MPSKPLKNGTKNIVLYMNCGLNRGRDSEEAHPDECNFCGTVSIEEGYVWKYSPTKKTTGNLRPAEQRESEKSPKRKSPTVNKSCMMTAECPRCGYYPPDCVVLDDKQRDEANAMLSHMFHNYFNE